jgi:hypothetical protein
VDAHKDVKIPNLALMKLGNYLQLDYDYVSATTLREIPDSKLFRDYDIVFVSCIFQYKYNDIVQQIVKKGWEHKTIIGGYGSPYTHTLEDLIGKKADIYDFSLYPWFEPNIGFSQRGCRLKCDFCFVPKFEGRNHSVNSIKDLIQKPTDKLVLLDNDFFGQKNWEIKADYALGEGLKISFNQGINIRLINEEQAEYLVAINPYNYTFKQRLLNTAWDQLKDEKVFRKKLGMLLGKGYKPGNVMVYMLVGFDPKESFEQIWYRFWVLHNHYKVFPYPMVFIACMDCTESYKCLPEEAHTCPKILFAKGFRQFRQWVIKHAKDRFVKHNTGKVDEKAYYKDFKEYFTRTKGFLPEEVYGFFSVEKFNNVKFDRKPQKRIRAGEREEMVSLWD